MKRTNVVVTIEHEEGQDPSKWKWPKHITTKGGNSGNIVGVAAFSDSEPRAENHVASIVPFATLRFAKITVDQTSDGLREQLSGALIPTNECMATLFGPGSDGLKSVFAKFEDDGGFVTKIRYTITNSRGDVSTWDEDFNPVDDSEHIGAPAASSKTGNIITGNIIVRLVGGEVSEVGFPATLRNAGFDVQVWDYDKGGAIKVKPGNELPANYGRDPIGVYKIETHAAGDE